MFVLQLKPYLSLLGDDITYLKAAKKIYSTFQASDDRPLLIAIIQGFPYLFGFSDNIVFYWGIMLNYLCWISTIRIIFIIISTHINRKLAFYTFLIFVFCIGNLALVFNFLSESIFVFFANNIYFFYQQLF